MSILLTRNNEIIDPIVVPSGGCSLVLNRRSEGSLSFLASVQRLHMYVCVCLCGMFFFVKLRRVLASKWVLTIKTPQYKNWYIPI